MSRPRGRLSGLDELRGELLRCHTDPNAFAADGPLPRPALGAFGNVVPLRPDVALPVETEPQDDRTDVVDLVARAQRGDAEAFGALYDRYLDLVYRYVYYRVGGKPLAEDLVSETFLRALRRIGTFEWDIRTDRVEWSASRSPPRTCSTPTGRTRASSPRCSTASRTPPCSTP
jgi:hypothetical protein